MNRLKNMLNKLWIAVELIVVLSFVAFCVIGYFHARKQRLYYGWLDFVRTLAEFVEKEERLPRDLHEFCSWERKGKPNPFSDFKQTRKWVDLNHLTMEEVIRGETPYIMIKEKETKYLEREVNKRFKERIDNICDAVNMGPKPMD